jgi:hypothetical protein
MTPENTRTRFTRNSPYPMRECWTCIRARRRAGQQTEAGRIYRRRYMAAHYGGSRAERWRSGPLKKVRLTGAETRAAWERHENLVGETRARALAKRARKRGAIQLAAERERLAIASIQVERAEELAIACTNPELAKLIEDQKRDDRTFRLSRSPRFVPQDIAERLFYGEAEYWKVGGRHSQEVARSYARLG